MFFARKFSTKKTPEILNLIDEYMLLNKTSEAGHYWPGFYDVDTTTPGKQWMQTHRDKKRKEYDLWRLEKKKGTQVTQEVGIVPSIKSYVTSLTSSSQTDTSSVSSETAVIPYSENENNAYKSVGEGRREKKSRKGKRQSISNAFGALA